MIEKGWIDEKKFYQESDELLKDIGVTMMYQNERIKKMILQSINWNVFSFFSIYGDGVKIAGDIDSNMIV
jgi:hypothetical protein